MSLASGSKVLLGEEGVFGEYLFFLVDPVVENGLEENPELGLRVIRLEQRTADAVLDGGRTELAFGQ